MDLNEARKVLKDNGLRLVENKNEDIQADNLEVGDIIYSRWGYNMVLYSFYQILAITPKSVKIVKLQKNSVGDWAYPHVSPIKDEFDGQPFTRRLLNRTNYSLVKINDYEFCHWKYNEGDTFQEDHMD